MSQVSRGARTTTQSPLNLTTTVTTGSQQGSTSSNTDLSAANGLIRFVLHALREVAAQMHGQARHMELRIAGGLAGRSGAGCVQPFEISQEFQ